MRSVPVAWRVDRSPLAGSWLELHDGRDSSLHQYYERRGMEGVGFGGVASGVTLVAGVRPVEQV